MILFTNQFYAYVREVNIVLAVIALWVLVRKVVQISRVSRRKDPRLRWMSLLALSVAIIGLASIQNTSLKAPAGPVSVLTAIFHVTVFCLALAAPTAQARFAKSG